MWDSRKGVLVGRALGLHSAVSNSKAMSSWISSWQFNSSATLVRSQLVCLLWNL